MGSQSEHYDKYRHNKNFIDNGIRNKDDFLDWYITGVFYCGVHLIEYVLASHKINSENHTERFKNLRVLKIDENVLVDYKNLYLLSKKSRYECIKIKNNDAVKAQQYLDSLLSFTNI